MKRTVLVIAILVAGLAGIFIIQWALGKPVNPYNTARNIALAHWGKIYNTDVERLVKDGYFTCSVAIEKDRETVDVTLRPTDKIRSAELTGGIFDLRDFLVIEVNHGDIVLCM